MFHYFKWSIKNIKWRKILANDFFWIEIQYMWNLDKWEFFLYPHIDDNKKTIIYFAFTQIDQKNLFEDLLKVNWIWTKTAFLIAQYPKEDLQNAIKNLDAKFFQSIQWIWPKTAKKIVLELKWSIDLEDIRKIDIDQKLFKSIVSSLKWFGYDTESIKQTLQKYDWEVSKDNLPKIVKRIISNI